MPPNLSKFESQVYLFYQAKTPTSTIATTLKKDIKSIKNTIQRIKKKLSNPSTVSRVIDGRITKLKPREKRQLNRDLERSPKKTNKRLLLENPISISLRGLQRFIKEEGYTISVANKKPIINRKNALLRVKYCKEQLRRLKNKEFNLKKIIFSDESGIEAGHGARQEYYRKRGKKEPGRSRISMNNRSTFKNKPSRLYFFIFSLLSFYLIGF